MRNGGPDASQVCLNHVFIDRDYDSSVVGLAYVGVACDQSVHGRYVTVPVLHCEPQLIKH